MISIIVAYDANFVMGKGNQLPWHIPADLKRFKERTTGHVVIMGRKTWESLPKKPLPGRINLILSRTMSCDSPDTFVLADLHEAITFAHEKYPEKEIFIIGGRQVYEQALRDGVVDVIYLTYVHGEHDGDIFFPNDAYACEEPSCVHGHRGWFPVVEGGTEECTFFKITDTLKDPLA